MEVIGLFGYGVAAFGFFILSILILSARSQVLQVRLMLYAALCATLGFASAAFQSNQLLPLPVAIMVDTLRIISWSLLLYAFSMECHSLRQLLRAKRTITYLALSFGGFFFIVAGVAFDQLHNTYFYLLYVGLNLWLLVLLEQLFRNSDGASRWSLWPLIIGLGALTVFDFVMYAQASMVSSVDFAFWYARGLIAIASLPLLLISLRRVKRGEIRIFVSRQVVFYSSMLLIAGLYLLLMAFSGYLINYFGGEWGDLISISFLALGAMVLAVLLVTESFRRRIKVLIAKHFLRTNTSIEKSG